MGSLSKGALALFGVLAATFFLQPYRPVIVRGESMLPTFNDGQLVFSTPLKRAPQQGDIVILEHNGATLVKRVTKVPGDTFLEVRSVHSPFWFTAETRATMRLAKMGKVPSRIATVPSGMVFVTGDNPDHSLDSRQFGYVPITAIRGLVVPTSS